MIVRVNQDNIDEYENFIKKHPKGLFQHSSKWAKVKSAWKFEAVMLKDENGEIKGSASVLIRSIPIIKNSLINEFNDLLRNGKMRFFNSTIFNVKMKGKKYAVFTTSNSKEKIMYIKNFYFQLN